MKNRKGIIVLVTLLATMFVTDIYSCTSAIITGKITPDGRPLLWKHRDTGELNNRIEYFKGEKYNFIALVNSPENVKEAWTGVNTVGFSIMNTASYNLKNDNVAKEQMDKEGVLMYKALSVCKNLKDFEKFLDKYSRPIGVEANFGVIDAEGGAAYYEVNNSGWVKIDVNDPKIAPQGYLVYTNYSYTGRINEGMGYVRYATADNKFKLRVTQNGDITPEWIFNNLSRSFYNSILDLDLEENVNFIEKGSGFFVDQDFIPRKSTSASIVVAGVKKGEDPMNTVMWTVLGYPPVSPAVPLFIRAEENQPWYMVKNGASQESKKYYEFTGIEQKEDNSFVCDLALKSKAPIFPVSRGNGNKYFNFGALYNSDVTGKMQNVKEVEKNIFLMSNEFINENRDKVFDGEKYRKFYDSILNIILLLNE